MSTERTHSIRLAVPGDWNGISKVERACFGDHGYSAYFLKMAPRILAEHLWIAEDSTGIVGYSLGARESHATGNGWVLSLAVMPSATGRGVGSALAAGLIESFEAAGVRSIYLSVEPSNDAVRLYERLGFVAQSTDDEFFGPGQPRVIMVRRA